MDGLVEYGRITIAKEFDSQSGIFQVEAMCDRGVHSSEIGSLEKTRCGLGIRSEENHPANDLGEIDCDCCRSEARLH